MNLIEEMRQLVSEHDTERGAAHDLWSWLPSYTFSKKAHGDYAIEHGFDVACVMREAAVVFSYLKGYSHDLDNDFRAVFGCGCGECPVPSVEEVEAVLKGISVPAG